MHSRPGSCSASEAREIRAAETTSLNNQTHKTIAINQEGKVRAVSHCELAYLAFSTQLTSLQLRGTLCFYPLCNAKIEITAQTRSALNKLSGEKTKINEWNMQDCTLYFFISQVLMSLGTNNTLSGTSGRRSSHENLLRQVYSLLILSFSFSLTHASGQRRCNSHMRTC